MNKFETFKVSAELKNIIGKELITDEFVAVFELVKNAFDANATEVNVIFENNHIVNKSRIIIQDNGKGMNDNDLKRKWLVVAYSAKRLNKENDNYRDKIKSKRIFAGAKGIGRFSCDRLGRHLNLITIKNEKNPKVENLSVNWEDFEDADEENFIDIKVSHKTLSKIDYKIKHGTVLEISGLRDEWSRKKILDLKRSLVKLINPNQGNDSDNFSIRISANDELAEDKLPNKEGEKRNDWETVNGTITNSVFETLKIKTSNIAVKISSDGEHIETTLQDRGDLIYLLKEKNPYPDLHNISIYLFQLNRSAKTNFHKIMGMRSLSYGTVFMYKNGFRIYPFGEQGDDSLHIDRRKAQGYNRFLGNRDIIGRIEINGDQPELREISSRDGGLVKTAAYENLVSFFYDYVLKSLENYVVNVIQWGDPRIIKSTGEEIPALWAKDVKVKILELISGHINSKNIIDIQYDKKFLKIIKEKQDQSTEKILRNISSVANKSDNPQLILEAKKIGKAVKDTRADTEKALKLASNEKRQRIETQDELNYIIGQNSFLKNDINDDTKNLESILHHIGLSTNFIKSDIKNLVQAINNDLDKNELLTIVKRLSRQNEKITSFSKYFKKVNFNIHSNKLSADIVSFAEEYLENVYKLRPDLKSNRELLNIHFITPEKIPFTLKFNPIDLIIILDNLMSNSFKHGASNVYIHWEKLNSKSIVLSFSDDGEGISDNIKPHIFDFGFTSSRRGSGIGLYHAKEIIEKLHGSINIGSDNKKGAQFLLTFNK